MLVFLFSVPCHDRNKPSRRQFMKVVAEMGFSGGE